MRLSELDHALNERDEEALRAALRTYAAERGRPDLAIASLSLNLSDWKTLARLLRSLGLRLAVVALD